MEVLFILGGYSMEQTVAIVVMVGSEPVTVIGWMVIYESAGLVILRVKLGMKMMLTGC